MIITCPNCKKKFKIDPSQIPLKGRNLQCGSCGNGWFFKFEDENSEVLNLNNDFPDNELESKNAKNYIEKKFEYKEIKTNFKPSEKEKNFKKSQQKQKSAINKVKEEKSESKFFANLIVCIISIVALFILVYTVSNVEMNCLYHLNNIFLSELIH